MSTKFREERESEGWTVSQFVYSKVISVTWKRTKGETAGPEKLNHGARVTDLAVPPYEQCADWSEQNTDDEKSGKDGFGGENGLPCLQALLLEGGICELGQQLRVELR